MLDRRSRLGCNSMDGDIDDFESRRHRAAPAPRRSATRRSRQRARAGGRAKRPSTRSLIRLFKTLSRHPTRRRPLSQPKRSPRAILKLSRNSPAGAINGRCSCFNVRGLPLSTRVASLKVVGLLRREVAELEARRRSRGSIRRGRRFSSAPRVNELVRYLPSRCFR